MDRIFYIFRHGETDWNKERRCQGHTNTFLNDNGRAQAMELASRLQAVKIDVIVSSDLHRAFSTGVVVAEKKGIPIIAEPRFREMSYGQAEGMLYEEAISNFGEDLWQRFQNFHRKNDHVGFPGGETRKIVKDRFLSAIMDLIEKTTHQHIGISTHGGALRNLLHHFLPEDHLMLPIPNCVVYKFQYLASTNSFVVYPEPF